MSGERRGSWPRLMTGHEHGFTLLEMATVISIVGILVSLALPTYKQSVVKAREAALIRDLMTIRDSIDQYRSDTGRYPNSMQDLADKEYLRAIPKDPFTNTQTSWQEMLDPIAGGVFDVHSGSMLVGTNGTPYNEW